MIVLRNPESLLPESIEAPSWQLLPRVVGLEGFWVMQHTHDLGIMHHVVCLASLIIIEAA